MLISSENADVSRNHGLYHVIHIFSGSTLGKVGQNSRQCWIFDLVYVEGDVKLRDHRHITGKCRSSAHRDCNANVKLNHKIPTVFHILKNYDSHLIMQKLGKFDSKLNVILNGLGKYMSFNINNMLTFIDSVQFLNSSLDSLV